MYKEKFKSCTGNIFGGLNASIIALPQALAFGVAAGFGAEAGIWGTIILCFSAVLISGKAPVISGITGPVTIAVASIMTALNFDTASVLSIIALAGVFQILLALTPFSNIVKYIPYPVISGFLNGIGIIIIIMQINPLAGGNVVSGTIASISAFFHNLRFVNFEALFLGILTLFIVFVMPKKFNKIIPSDAIALIICTFISIKLNLNVEKISGISSSFPALCIPEFDIQNIITHLHYALILSVVLSTESLLTVLVSDSLLKTKTSPEKILAGQGIGNIISSFFGCLPGSAATMRTAAAINSGASSKSSAVFSALILAVLIFIFSDFVSQIPLCVLAGILIKTGFRIIDVKLLKVLKYAPKEDLYILLSVFALTVFYNLTAAIVTGITGAAILYAKKMADKTKLIHKAVYNDEIIKLEKDIDKNYRHRIRIVHINGSFFFGSATQLVSQFEEIWGTEYLILDYPPDDLLDISAVFALEDIIIRLQDQNIKILLVLGSMEVFNQLETYKIISQIGKDNVFFTEFEAVEFAKKLLPD